MSKTVNFDDILLIGDKVLLKQIKPEEYSEGGLFLGKADRVDNFYEIVAVGPGLNKDKPMTACVGDQVILPDRPMGQFVTIDDEKYLVCKEFELPLLVRSKDESDNPK